MFMHAHPAFLAHAFLELPPSIFLIFSPLSFLSLSDPVGPITHHSALLPQTLAVPASAIIPVLRQYGAMLLCSSIFAFMLAVTPNAVPVLTDPIAVGGIWTLHDVTALALAVYHGFTVHRAYTRIRGGERPFVLAAGGKGMGGPGLHFIVHCIVGGMLGWFAITGRDY